MGAGVGKEGYALQHLVRLHRSVLRSASRGIMSSHCCSHTRHRIAAAAGSWAHPPPPPRPPRSSASPPWAAAWAGAQEVPLRAPVVLVAGRQALSDGGLDRAGRAADPATRRTAASPSAHAGGGHWEGRASSIRDWTDLLLPAALRRADTLPALLLPLASHSHHRRRRHRSLAAGRRNRPARRWGRTHHAGEGRVVVGP